MTARVLTFLFGFIISTVCVALCIFREEYGFAGIIAGLILIAACVGET